MLQGSVLHLDTKLHEEKGTIKSDKDGLTPKRRKSEDLRRSRVPVSI